ncbi:acyltransferase [Nocardioides panacisoli]|uniref:acyltransferase family protein n=1 Tax=Nocardioides panacisoli TaxID=627624 RepID=UPI001C629ED5|nr:acyltransferase family protein [Nocardioides panacisoli]QYJ02549.1 acyltransferase [Nocardioides panacisoli]
MTNSDTATGRPRAAKVKFRGDIQGMRALAVLLIIAYHAGLDLYPGGFVTLDIFFVISGFLITFLLLKEINRTGTLSLSTFYQRRARRILPAATVTALVTLAATWFWLNLIAAEEAAYDAVWAAMFAANIRFATENTDYFAQGEAPSPFQHYWSLSVEEQFYVFLPLLLLACVAYAAKRAATGTRADRDPTRTIFVALAVITALSFAWSIYASTVSPQTAYFSTLTRIWEFGVGGLLAVVAPKYAGPLTARARNLLGVLGLVAIAVAAFIITPQTAFPGYAALLPVLGTAAIIFAGTEMSEAKVPATQRALGCKPMRLIGDASYSLYLWHWPIIIVATQYVGRDLSARGMVFAIAIIFAVSFASYYWIETPLRRGLPKSWGDGLVLYPATVTMVCAASVLITVTTHVEIDGGGGAITTEEFDRAPSGDELDSNPVVAQVQASARAAQEGADVPADLNPPLLELKDDIADVGDCDYGAAPWSLCPRGDTESDRTMVVLGNSHGRHWIPAIDKIAERAGLKVYYLVKSQCTAVRADLLRAGADEIWQECEDFNDWAQTQIEEMEPEVVAVSTTAGTGVLVDGERETDIDVLLPAVRDGFEKLITEVQPHTGEVVMLGDIPRRSDRIGECLSNRGVNLGDCAGGPSGRQGKFTTASEEAAEKTGARYVDTWPWFCSDGVCPPVIGDTIPYRDRNHMTTEYAEQLAEPLGRAMKLWNG